MSSSSEFFTLAPVRGNPNGGLLEVRSSIFKLETALKHRKRPQCNQSRFHVFYEGLATDTLHSMAPATQLKPTSCRMGITYHARVGYGEMAQIPAGWHRVSGFRQESVQPEACGQILRLHWRSPLLLH